MRTNRFLGGIAAVVAALTLFAGSTAAQTPPSGAQQPAAHPITVVGKISAVGATSVTLQTRNGAVTANTSGGTWVVVDKAGKATEGTLKDLKVDKPAAVSGMTTATAGVINARVVAQTKQPLQALQRAVQKHEQQKKQRQHAAAGTITAINGTVFTLQGERVAVVTVNTSAGTVVVNNGFVPVSSLKVGDKVAVLGKPAGPQGAAPAAPPAGSPAARTIDAWGIKVDNANTKMAAAHVQAVNGNAIAARLRRGGSPVTITVDASTGYRSLTIVDGKPVIANATLSDVKAGSNLLVEGVHGTEGKNLTAKAVVIMPSSQR